MLKVLGILGSARKGGNTDLLLQSALEGARAEGAEIELVRLADLKINPCLNCGGCDEDGVCVQQDDMQGLFEKLLNYDIILLASPIYFMGVSAWTKAFIDRCQSLWVRKYKLERLPAKPREARKGVFISVAGMKKPTVFEGAKLTVKSFFATIHVTYLGELVYTEIDAKGDISRHPTALKEARELGEMVVKKFDDPNFKITKDTSEMMVEHTRQ
jgi:multimeric flavodoxin WrbA